MMPTIFKQIMAVWLVACTVSISAQKTTYTLVKNPAESMSMASVDDAFSSLSYSHVDLNVDANGKEDLYIRLGEESQNPRIFLFEKVRLPFFHLLRLQWTQEPRYLMIQV